MGGYCSVMLIDPGANHLGAVFLMSISWAPGCDLGPEAPSQKQGLVIHGHPNTRDVLRKNLPQCGICYPVDGVESKRFSDNVTGKSVTHCEGPSGERSAREPSGLAGPERGKRSKSCSLRFQLRC